MVLFLGLNTLQYRKAVGRNLNICLLIDHLNLFITSDHFLVFALFLILSQSYIFYFCIYFSKMPSLLVSFFFFSGLPLVLLVYIIYQYNFFMTDHHLFKMELFVLLCILWTYTVVNVI